MRRDVLLHVQSPSHCSSPLFGESFPVEKPKRAELLEIVEASEPIARKLARDPGQWTAGRVFARRPVCPGIPRCHHRAQHRQDDLGLLPERSFPGIALREFAQLATRCALPAGSGVRRRRKHFARSRNRGGTARASHAPASREGSASHCRNAGKSRPGRAEARSAPIRLRSASARNE